MSANGDRLDQQSYLRSRHNQDQRTAIRWTAHIDGSLAKTVTVTSARIIPFRQTIFGVGAKFLIRWGVADHIIRVVEVVQNLITRAVEGFRLENELGARILVSPMQLVRLVIEHSPANIPNGRALPDLTPNSLGKWSQHESLMADPPPPINWGTWQSPYQNTATSAA